MSSTKIIIPLVAAGIGGACTILASYYLKKPPTYLNNPFASKQPLPEPYKLIQPGHHLSLLKSTYTGRLVSIYDSPCYEVVSDSIFFARVQYFFHETEADPKINRVVLIFRNNKMAKKVREFAVLTFSDCNLIPTTSDSLIWHISGKKVTIKQYKTCEVEENGKKEIQ